ncbi:YchJ family metal-binding protein [Actinoplanes sp. NPDC051470]|uniref:YchJ family protein n=1 Tax=unclassified Actinoplanes TaxID=2626549 RepID=UPI0034424534
MTCPCGLGLPYAECCGPAHNGTAPPTAESLMRSRYTAFAMNRPDYLLSTWHPDTRPATIEPDPGTQWTGLTVLAARGGLLDTEGEVEFVARYLTAGRRARVQERSRFLRHDSKWVYWGAL